MLLSIFIIFKGHAGDGKIKAIFLTLILSVLLGVDRCFIHSKA